MWLTSKPPCYILLTPSSQREILTPASSAGNVRETGKAFNCSPPFLSRHVVVGLEWIKTNDGRRKGVHQFFPMIGVSAARPPRLGAWRRRWAAWSRWPRSSAPGSPRERLPREQGGGGFSWFFWPFFIFLFFSFSFFPVFFFVLLFFSLKQRFLTNINKHIKMKVSFFNPLLVLVSVSFEEKPEGKSGAFFWGVPLLVFFWCVCVVLKGRPKVQRWKLPIFGGDFVRFHGENI